MANLAPAPLVNAKVYRHFAAITFAVTLSVALLANGEVRQTVGGGIAQEQETARLRDADTKKFGARKLGTRRLGGGSQSGFGEDYDPRYGATSDSGGSLPTSFASGDADDGDLPAASDATAAQPAVLSPDEVAQLTPDEQRAYMNRMRNRKAAAKRADEPRDLAAIEAGSRARSGSSTDD